MPGPDLTGGDYVGLFGKLPTAGDFVFRGLGESFRARWDRWLTRHLAGRAHWPAGGLRFRLRSGGRAASGLVLPSRDAVGRRFPLSVLVVQTVMPSAEAVERWCDAALPLAEAAQAGRIDADALWHGLDALPRPEAGEPHDALLLWLQGTAPRPADPAAPGPVVTALFSSAESSSP